MLAKLPTTENIPGGLPQAVAIFARKGSDFTWRRPRGRRNSHRIL